MIKRFYCMLQALVVSSPLLAMQHASPIYTPPNNTHLFSVVCCKNKIFMAGSNGVKIYNDNTKTVTTLSEQPTFHIATDRRAINVAISNQTELAVYDTKTEQKTWSTRRPLNLWRTTPIIFNSTDDTICSYQKGTFTFHHFKTLSLRQFNVPHNINQSAYCVQIACHPTKKKFLYPSGKQTVSVVTPNRFREVKKTIISPQSNYIFNALYNSDATVIAINDTYQKCCLYDVTNNSVHILEHSIPSTSSNYISMVFHPHKNIVALLTNNSSIHYWNYKTKQIIAITSAYRYSDMDESIQTIYFSRTKRLDFSPNGKSLAVVLPDACYILPTPLNNLIMICYTLLHNGLPHDIIKIIVNIIPHVLELQHLNFFELLKI